MSTQAVYDLLIIGGGVNGTGIARDAAGRGLKILLVEKDDLAQHTSSASTKLIHGGLRYLEYYEFRLVREALQERERLLNLAPHIIHPLKFVLPHRNAVRPAWMIRAGLFLYDHLACHPKLPNAQQIAMQKSPYGQPLRNDIKKGFTYSDCAVDDSRLVVLNAKGARNKGADIRTQTTLLKAERKDDVWEAIIQDNKTQDQTTVQAKAIVNAAGPWVAEVLQDLQVKSSMNVRLVKGSHIVVKKLFDGPQAYILQNADKRIVFAIPYHEEFTLIGTTDLSWDQSPDALPKIDQDETQYLCDSINNYFTKNITPKDVIWDYSGVRPLYDDAASNASAVTRDYHLDLNQNVGKTPLLSIFGGKITTYRRLAEHSMEQLAPFFQYSRGSWTGSEALPGGHITNGDFKLFYNNLRKNIPFLDEITTKRMAHAYGTDVFEVLNKANSKEDLGTDFGHGLSQREVDYLIEKEWAITAEDILWRRTKLGLYFSQDEIQNLQKYLAEKLQ
ncbi:Glycerol-3-phosphate dehydrogenase (GlpA) (PDB:2RGH) [Commensalibacter communis]|uniref:glycerol-3-phosphate dehydrogenase n=1 Tax=Commensalibacter communis TaxID=2972786 RepID=UPI0022FFBE60|nr:glycerol-3-phosphate dehydrogenase [Commensalibacter communis]CAI3940138.1 Glycerol-3-phosphate dehydrogenase (GlpA) (PDB:2RGH) [Commensalibacter communis]